MTNHATSLLFALFALLTIFGGAWATPAQAAPSAYCPTLTATVARGGSVAIDVSNCDGPSNIGIGTFGTTSPHGTYASSGQSGSGFETVTYTHNGDSATSDSFTLEDEDNGIITVNVTITQPAPTITSVAPAAGPTSGGTTVVLTGTNFGGATSVAFGANAATSFTINSATQITAIAPSRAAGTVNIQVVTPGGTSAIGAANQFTYVSAPTVSGITPAEGLASASQSPANVTINGSGFSSSGNAVTFGGVAGTIVSESATTLVVTPPARGSGGLVNVVVTEGGGQSTTSSNAYRYLLPPTVSVSFSQSSLVGAQTTGFSVTLTNPNPVELKGVRVASNGGTTPFSLTAFGTFCGSGNYNASSAFSLNSIDIAANGSCTATSTQQATASGVFQFVTNAPTSSGTTSTAVTLTGVPASSNTITVQRIAPVISSVTPSSGPQAGGTNVVLTGSNLTGVTAVAVGGVAATNVVVVNDARITFTTGASGASGVVAVTATNSVGTGTRASTFNYIAPPVVTTVTPAMTSTAGGATITLNGSGLSGSTVTVDGVTVNTVQSTATVRAFTAPAHAPGTVNVVVTTAGGSTTTQLTYVVLPSVTSVSPAQGTTAGGQSITITGSGFTGMTGVNVGSASATGVIVDSDTQITATTPAGAAGAATVSVTTAAGSSTSNGTYTYLTSPTADAQSVTTAYQTARAITLQGINATSYVYTQPTSGTGSVSGTGPNVTYTPAVGYSGTTSFSFTTTNGTGPGAPQSAAATITITVTPAPPTILTQPSDQIVPAGAAATFSAAASGSPTVQWQESFDGGGSWTNIAGATATSYTTPATTTSDDGKRFRAVFANAGGTTNSNAATLTVLPPTIVIAPTTLPNATVGAAYSQTMTSSGGTSPYTYIVTAGTLPTGLMLDSGGVLSGTPTAVGTFGFTLMATDSSSGGGGPFSGSRTYSLTVAAATIALSPSTLPAGGVGATYSQTVTASGGTAPYSYAVTAGALPAGVTLAGNGSLSGTPTAGGSFNFTITATDSSTGVGAPFTASRAYALSIAAPTVTLTPATLPAATTGAAYSQTLTADGGVAPYSYAVTAGALPAGVSLGASGVLSGTPTAGGTFNFTVAAIDSATGAGPYSGTRAYALTVNAAALTLAPVSLSGGQSGVAYDQTLTASGGVAPYSYAVTAGALPAGLTLDASTGAIDGTPRAQGTFNFTITSTDSATGVGPGSVSQAYSVVIAAPTIVIAPASLPAGAAGVDYSQTLSASGGTPPYAYTISAGALPAGVTLSSGGALFGMPTASGSFNFTVTATDATSGAAAPYAGARAYTLIIGSPTLVLSSATLPNATTGASYSATVSASGGTAPYSYAVTAGALPAGVTLASDGTLSGLPTEGGTFNFTITTTDSSTGAGAPFTVSRAYALTVGAATIAITPTTLPAGQVEAIYTQGLSASGGTAPYAFVVTTGALPSGLTLSTAGVLSGTPTASGSFNFGITATDSSGGSGPFSGTQAYALVIAAPNPPVAGNVSTTVTYGSADNPVMAALTGGAADSIAVATSPAHGTVTVSGLRFLYTPAADYFGADSFTYTASNGGGASTPATVSITVGTPPAPVTTSVSGVLVPYASPGLTIDLSGSISGIYDSVAVATTPAHGTVSVSGAVATYQPAAEYFGADSFSFTASGPGGASSASTVSLTVAPPAPPTVTPPPAVVVPPASGGGSAPASVDLGARTQGVTDGYRVTVDARFGSGVIASSGATVTAQSVGSNGVGPQAVETFQLVYTPVANFIGTDTVTVVAFGPGGDSAPATFTFQVAGKAPDLSGSVVSSGTLTVSPTATLVGGPFQALRITRQPAFGTATVQGLNIIYTPGAANGGSTSLDYVIDLAFGSSAAGRLDLTVGQVPASQALVADTIQGRPVTVRISDAAGGPFTAAAVTSISPTTAGSAVVAGTGGIYDLTFTPQDAFSGQATISFTLTNASGTSTGALTVTVAARPDPSLDPEVRGVASGQITAARRFSDTQVDNFQRRLEGLRDGSNRSRNGLSLNFGGVGGQDDRDPRVALRRQLGQDQRLDPGALGDGRDRDMLGLNFGSDRDPAVKQATTQAGQLNAAPAGQGVTQGSRSVGVWTSGSVDWGRQDAQDLRDSRFTTQGVTGGLDVRLNDHLIVGGGLGYGEDKTRIGDNGSTSRGKATTGALYASWRPADGWFVDGVVGLSRLDFDSRRWVVGLLDEADGYADGQRSGDVRFASASIGRTLRRQGLAADLYVRMEGRDIALDAFTETSGGLSALTWDALDQSGLSVNLGASWRWSIESRRFGVLRPTARLEWSHELEDIETQGVRYADWAASPTYLIPLDGWSRDALNLDLGTEWSLSDRLMLSLGYRGMLGDASASHGGLIGLKYGW